MISFQALMVLALVLVGCYLLGKWGFGKDTEIENRRKAAGMISGVMSRYGLVRLPRIFLDYSVGDYSGVANEMEEFAKLMLQGEEAVIKEFDEVYNRVLEVKLTNPESRAYLKARLEQTAGDAAQSPNNSPVTPAPAPVLAA